MLLVVIWYSAFVLCYLFVDCFVVCYMLCVVWRGIVSVMFVCAGLCVCDVVLCCSVFGVFVLSCDVVCCCLVFCF